MRRHSGQQSGAAAGAGRRCAVRLVEHKALPRKSHKVRVVGGNTVRLHIPPTVMRVNVDEIHFFPFPPKRNCRTEFFFLRQHRFILRRSLFRYHIISILSFYRLQVNKNTIIFIKIIFIIDVPTQRNEARLRHIVCRSRQIPCEFFINLF